MKNEVAGEAPVVRSGNGAVTQHAKSGILCCIIRELEFQVNKCIPGAKVILSKLGKNHEKGIRLPLEYLLRLAQYYDLKLTSDVAVSVLFAMKRVKSKMALFKSVLYKYGQSVSGAAQMTWDLSKTLGKMKLNEKHGQGRDGELARQLLKYLRSLQAKDCSKFEIALYTDWPECFSL